jgi:hypothetical protein
MRTTPTGPDRTPPPARTAGHHARHRTCSAPAARHAPEQTPMRDTLDLTLSADGTRSPPSLRSRAQPTAIASATAAPTVPVIAMTNAGEWWSAAAPARTMTIPWPRLMPPWARPKAWLRCACGAALTKAALAAI